MLCLLGMIACSNGDTTTTKTSVTDTIDNGNVFTDGPVELVSYADEGLSESEFSQYQEYKRNQSAFDAINITAAWQKGANGDGVIIGIIDTEVYNGHEFIGKNLTHISEIEFSSGDTQYKLTMDPKKLYNMSSHGSAVAAIAAGNFDAIRESTTNITEADLLMVNGIVGVAYGASVVDMPGLTIDCAQSGCSPPGSPSTTPYTSFDISQVSNDYFQAILQATLDADAKFVNMSWGYATTLAAILDSGSQTAASIAANLSGTIQAIAQANTATAEQSVFVISAGNSYSSWGTNNDGTSYADDPIILAELPLLDDSLEGLVIAAVALNDENDRNTLSYYSNGCGVAHEFCLAAPGTVYSSDVRGDSDTR